MEKKTLKGRLDYTAMIIPLLGVVLLCVLFMIMPAKFFIYYSNDQRIFRK